MKIVNILRYKRVKRFSDRPLSAQFRDLNAIFKDPDNPGRVCLGGCVLREYVFQAKDEQYTDWNWLRADRPEGKRLLSKSLSPKK